MATLASLPPELIHDVAQRLDHTSLGQFSITSKRIRFATFAILFHSVTFPGSFSCDSIELGMACLEDQLTVRGRCNRPPHPTLTAS